MAVCLAIVQAEADDEAIRQVEADVADWDVRQPVFGLVEQGANFKGRRPARSQGAQEIIQRQAGVHDIFDENQMATFYWHHPGL